MITGNESVRPKSMSGALFRRRFEFVVIGGVLVHRGKDGVAVVPKYDDLFNIIADYHDGLGHFSPPTILEYLKPRFWHPALSKMAKSFIRSCGACQRYNMKRPFYKFDG